MDGNTLNFLQTINNTNNTNNSSNSNNTNNNDSLNQSNKKIIPDESSIINTIYYEQLKDQLICSICYGLLLEPLMCSVCESAFCSECITTWMDKNGSCPLKCSYPNFSIKDVHITKKKILDGLKLRCKYGCEVPLLSFYSHQIPCENNNKEIRCWNCNHLTKQCELRVKVEKDFNKQIELISKYNESQKEKDQKINLLEDKIEELEIEKYKDKEKYEVEISSYRDKLEKVDIDISDLRHDYEEKLLKMKNDISVLRYENSNLVEQYSKKDEEKLRAEKEIVELKIKLAGKRLADFKRKNDDNSSKKELFEEKLSKYQCLLNKITSEEKAEKDKLITTEFNANKEIEDLNQQIILLNYSIEKVMVFRENLQTEDKFLITKEIQIVTSFINPKNDNFQFFNGNKTIKVVSGGKWDWLGFFCKDKIVNVGIQEFSIKIESTKDAYFLIGFAVAGTPTAKGLHNTEHSWMCDLYDGEFYNAGSHGNYFWEKNTVKLITGDIISISLDTVLNQLTMKRNGLVVGSSLNMKLKDGNKQKLHPCVDMRDVGDQITIV